MLRDTLAWNSNLNAYLSAKLGLYRKTGLQSQMNLIPSKIMPSGQIKYMQCRQCMQNYKKYSVEYEKKNVPNFSFQLLYILLKHSDLVISSLFFLFPYFSFFHINYL